MLYCFKQYDTIILNKFHFTMKLDNRDQTLIRHTRKNCVAAYMLPMQSFIHTLFEVQCDDLWRVRGVLGVAGHGVDACWGSGAGVLQHPRLVAGERRRGVFRRIFQKVIDIKKNLTLIRGPKNVSINEIPLSDRGRSPGLRLT